MDVFPKSKFIVLWLFYPLVLILIYYISIRPTIELRESIDQYNKLDVKNASGPEEVESIRKQLKSYNQLLAENYKKGMSLTDKLIGIVSKLCLENNCIIREIPYSQTLKSQNYSTETVSICVEGDFHGLLKLLYSLETENRPGGKLTNVLFSLEKKHNKKDKLLMKIIYQNVINHD